MSVYLAFCPIAQADDPAKVSKDAGLESIENAPDDQKIDRMLDLMRSKSKPGNPESDCLEGFGYYAKYNTAHEAALKKRYSSLALEYVKRSADAGFAQCQSNLGRFYLDGSIVERNPVIAREWFERAVTKKDCAAEFGLGLIYYHGWGVEKDLQRAVSYLSPSADRECGASAEVMGVIEYEGRIGKPDYDSAGKHFAIAMNSGRGFATRNLGLMYLNGHGVNKNVVEGAALCRYAMDLSHDDELRVSYEFAMKKVSPEELPKVEERYQYFKQGMSKKRSTFFWK